MTARFLMLNICVCVTRFKLSVDLRMNPSFLDLHAQEFNFVGFKIFLRYESPA